MNSRIDRDSNKKLIYCEWRPARQQIPCSLNKQYAAIRKRNQKIVQLKVKFKCKTIAENTSRLHFEFASTLIWIYHSVRIPGQQMQAVIDLDSLCVA